MRPEGEKIVTNNNQTPSTSTGSVPEDQTAPKKGWRKLLERAGEWLPQIEKQGDQWLKDMRGNLSLVATVISTMTFQVAVNPPGGIIQPSNREEYIRNCLHLNATSPCPGEAVLGALYPRGYFWFLLCNTISFIASLSVCLLLVSGIPLNRRIPMRLLSIGMCLTLTFLGLTYMCGVSMVTPGLVWGPTRFMKDKWLEILIGLLATVSLLLMIVFVIWLVNECIKKLKASTTLRTNKEISIKET